MRHHREVIEDIRKHPSMMLWERTYDGVVNFIMGYDQGCAGGMLEGFQEWLALHHGGSTSERWRERVLEIAFPGVESARAAVSASDTAQGHAIDTLLDLLADFDRALSSDPDALGKIYIAYDKQLRELGGDPPPATRT